VSKPSFDELSCFHGYERTAQAQMPGDSGHACVAFDFQMADGDQDSVLNPGQADQRAKAGSHGFQARSQREQSVHQSAKSVIGAAGNQIGERYGERRARLWFPRSLLHEVG
jgi:hypothetical protein